MRHVGKNYRTDGGDRTVIGGTLEFTDDAQVLNFPGGAGGANAKVALQADSTATSVAGLVTDFNALLAKLKAAGLMATE